MEKKKDQGGEKLLNNKINNEPHPDRGAELLLRRRRKPEPKTFQINFGKMVSLFKRDFYLSFDIIFDIKKQEE
tara:strand:+ start:1957 stop:2175 length:219 start_codon:yes stop_codon:yes gene_type:complete